MSTPDDDLPEPEIETIRNRSEHVAWLAAHAARGGFVALDGRGVQENAVDLSVLSQVLEHFDRLVRIVRADRGGLEVRRSGRVADIAGARRLVAVPAVGGSFAVPLRLEAPEGTMVAADHGELEAVIELLAEPDDSLDERLADMPERVGDELVSLLQVVAQGDVTLVAEAYDGGELTAEARVDEASAGRRSRRLKDRRRSEPGFDTLSGTLFRVDAKRTRIAIDVSAEGEDVAVQEASFNLEMLDQLRPAIHKHVEVDVSVLEERRPYERTARSRSLSVVRLRIIDD